jgi:ADP-ribosylglycohydrolase
MYSKTRLKIIERRIVSLFKNQSWLRAAEDVAIEMRQLVDEGKDITSLLTHGEQMLKALDSEKEQLAVRLFLQIKQLPMQRGYAFDEPSELSSIKAKRKIASINKAISDSDNASFNKIYGGWIGRCAGCLLGQPVEWWTRERIRGLLDSTENWPVSRYISSDISVALREKYKVVDQGKVYGSNRINWINNVDGMPEDDDTNYTILALKLLEEKGRDFVPEDVGEMWLKNLPVFHTCTAERIAYKNMLNLIPPPMSAEFQNPYREWIGAQIRADLYGYINPGDPEMAAEMAWRDACISHTKNGIYGAMYVAAMIAHAFVSTDAKEMVFTGLSQIPQNSRLYKQVMSTVKSVDEGASLEGIFDRIHKAYDQRDPHCWTHVIPNAMIVTASLLTAHGDFGRAIGGSISCGFDTDCNGATVGSIMGIMLGANALPAAWKDPLRDTVRSGVDGFAVSSISDLAKRTVKFIKV